MTQTATAPDGYGLIVCVPPGQAKAWLKEDGEFVIFSADDSFFPSAAAARAMAWQRYRDRYLEGSFPKTFATGHCPMSWETYPE